MYQHKFNVGQEVVLFNSVSGEIEKDYVFAVLFAPKGEQAESGSDLAKKIEEGKTVVTEEYQTLQHGIVGGAQLFASEAECKEYYRAFFAE